MVILVGGSAMVYVKSADSLPGDLIYPIKGIREDLDLARSDLSFENRAITYIKLTNNRFEEVVELINKKRDERDIRLTLEELISTQKRTLENIERARNHGKNMGAHIEQFELDLLNQHETLLELRYQVPPSLYEDMNKVLQEITTDIIIIKQMKARHN